MAQKTRGIDLKALRDSNNEAFRKRLQEIAGLDKPGEPDTSNK